MKKFLSVLTAAVCVIACAFGLAACGETHTHEWSEFWQIGETHHWHNCTAIYCPVTDNSLKNGYAAHDFSDGNCVCGKFASIVFVLNDDNASYSVKAGMGIDNETEIIIPAEYKGKPVTSIEQSAFSYCRSLTSVTIPDSVTDIRSTAFDGCSGLTSVTIPDSVTSISDHAFRACSGLTSITIGNSVTSIGFSAFNSCSSLTSLTIPDSVTSISEYAFSYCSSLTSITIPDSVTNIGKSALEGCSSLTSITIPDSVTSIGESAFRDCNSLKSVTVNENNAHYTSQDGILYNKEKTKIIHVPKAIIGAITIPGNVTIIDSFAFYGCNGLTSITIPGGVTYIGGSAFYGCNGLTSISIPDSVTYIGMNAFNDCSGLTNVTIGNGVTCIYNQAFYGCSSLTSITFKGTMALWNAIEKGYYWNSNTGDYTIHCTDGDIAKEN